jgi:predicted DNA-binding protein (MmcQ/YjbR family)
MPSVKACDVGSATVGGGTLANLTRATRGFKRPERWSIVYAMAKNKRPTAHQARPQAGTVLAELRAFGLSYPGAHLKSPWPGHLDLAVKDKTFAYLPPDGEPFSISVKLPRSAAIALLLPHTQPAAYGLGKSGWVAAEFPDGKLPPIDVLKAWIDESYRAQAPKTLVKQLDASGAAGQAPPRSTKPQPSTKSPPRAAKRRARVA